MVETGIDTNVQPRAPRGSYANGRFVLEIDGVNRGYLLLLVPFTPPLIDAGLLR